MLRAGASCEQYESQPSIVKTRLSDVSVTCEFLAIVLPLAVFSVHGSAWSKLSIRTRAQRQYFELLRFNRVALGQMNSRFPPLDVEPDSEQHAQTKSEYIH